MASDLDPLRESTPGDLGTAIPRSSSRPRLLVVRLSLLGHASTVAGARAWRTCASGAVNTEQLIRDLDIVREWSPDIVVLDEAQRIKNWATKAALTGEAPGSAVPSGADRHADGEPA
jgi:hypothetical protein